MSGTIFDTPSMRFVWSIVHRRFEMKSTVFVCLGVAMGISLAHAESLAAPELEPSIKGAVLASELYPLQEYAAAFRRGAYYACEQPRGGWRHYANMLRANCVAVDMSAGWDRSEILRHCYATPQRSTFERQAKVTCAALSAYPSFLLARENQSD